MGVTDGQSPAEEDELAVAKSGELGLENPRCSAFDWRCKVSDWRWQPRGKFFFTFVQGIRE